MNRGRISIDLAFQTPSPWQADGLVEDYDHYHRGEAVRVTSTVRDVTGNEPTSFSKFAKDYAERFLQKAKGAA